MVDDQVHDLFHLRGNQTLILSLLEAHLKLLFLTHTSLCCVAYESSWMNRTTFLPFIDVNESINRLYSCNFTMQPHNWLVIRWFLFFIVHDDCKILAHKTIDFIDRHVCCTLSHVRQRTGSVHRRAALLLHERRSVLYVQSGSKCIPMQVSCLYVGNPTKVPHRLSSSVT